MKIATITCESIRYRDIILSTFFSDRRMTEVPGAYTLATKPEWSIVVRVSAITVYRSEDSEENI